MNNTTINNADEARATADKIVTIMTSITEFEAAREREKNAVDARFDALIQPLKTDAETREKALRLWLKKSANQDAVFDDGNRSGHSSLATFGYRDSPPALKALHGKVSDVADRLYKEGRTEFLTVEAPRISINIGRIKEASLGAGALADLGLRWATKTTFYIEPRNATITRTTTTTVS